ncbi:hypothetical protein QTP88_012518 [Uroleucon formosanum]
MELHFSHFTNESLKLLYPLIKQPAVVAMTSGRRGGGSRPGVRRKNALGTRALTYYTCSDARVTYAADFPASVRIVALCGTTITLNKIFKEKNPKGKFSGQKWITV